MWKYDWEEAKEIGRGERGRVFRTALKESGEQFAIKRVRREGKEELLLQVQIQKKMANQHVVKIFQTFQDQNYFYIVMELCESSLSQLNAHEDYAKHLRYVRGLLKQLLSPLDLLVQNEISFCVLPQNVLVRNGVFKIRKFSPLNTLNQRRAMLYTAPQALQGNKFSLKNAVWNMGFLAYQLSFGRMPWQSRGKEAYLNQIKQRGLRYPHAKPLFKQLITFLEGSLCQESKRMSWEQLYSHSYLRTSHCTPTLPAPLTLPQITILLQVSRTLQANKLTLQSLFDSFKEKTGRQQLDLEAFQFMIKKLLKNKLTQIQILSLFIAVDRDSSGFLSLAELQKVISQIRVQRDRSVEHLKQLKSAMQKQKIGCEQLFRVMDLDGSNRLDRTEFNAFIRQLLHQIHDLDILKLFQLLAGSSPQISLDQFQAHFAALELPPQTTLSRPKRLLRSIKELMGQLEMSVEELLINVDLNGDGIDQEQLCSLIRLIDNRMRIGEERETAQEVFAWLNARGRLHREDLLRGLQEV